MSDFLARLGLLPLSPPSSTHSIINMHKLSTQLGRSIANSSPRVSAPRAPRTSLLVRANWGAPVEWKSAKVAGSKKAAEGLQTVLVELGERGAGYTTGGQYVQLKVGDAKPAFIALASPPPASDNGTVELLIKPVAGTVSETLAALQAGDVLECSPVQGKGFPADKAPVGNVDTVLLVATGSGISPIRALIESGALQPSKRSAVHLYYGARSSAHMAFQPLFAQWAAMGVRVVPVLSQPEEGWTGARGYVQDAIAQDVAKIADPARTAVFLCGQKQMVEGVKEKLVGAGVPAEHFFLNF